MINPGPAGDPAAVLRQMEEHINAHGRENLFRFVLEGVTDPGADLDDAYLERAAQAFHVKVINSTLPGYDLDAVLAEEENSITGVFAAKLLERMDGETDPERKAVLERALYIGLDALYGRKVIGR